MSPEQGHGVKLAGVRLSETGDLAVGGRDDDLALGDDGEEVWRAELGPVIDHLVAATRSTRVRSLLCSAV